MRLALFDLDRTLIDVNSGHLWVREEWRNGRVGLRTLLRSLWWFGLYAMGSETLDAAIDEAAALYKGIPVAEMEQRVNTWFDAQIRDRLRPGAAEAIARHKAAGDLCAMATSGSQFAAARATAAFGLSAAICTVVSQRDGILDGGLERSAFGRHKLDQCAEWARANGHDLQTATFYTDSYSDIPLLQRVGHPVVVNPDRRLHRAAIVAGWPIVDWGQARQRLIA